MTQLSKNKTLGTLGPAYSFHDILREEKLYDLPVSYFNSFNDIFEALIQDEIQVALVAIKNSIHGNVSTNSQMILDLNLDILESFDLPISLHLAAKKSISLDVIKKVYAHPIAWNECQTLFENTDIELINSASNSQALIDLKSESIPYTAAISGYKAIEESGLKIIKQDIHDTEPNITTFVLVSEK